MPGPARNPLSTPRLIAAVAAIALLGLIVALARAGHEASGRAAAQPDAEVALRQIGEFEAPVFVDDAPGARKLLFVVEQAGTIRVLRRGKPLARPFLDISEIVKSGGESGLLSVAFAPDYRKSRRFYVYFTNLAGAIEVDEFRRRRNSDTDAQEASRRKLIEIDHSAFPNHNGGQLQFGPDGYLYMATGDGGGAGDSLDNARDLDSLLGKLLRIDPTARKAPYAVPPDNPYVGRDGADEIYSYGLRNPYRFSFDSATGDLALSDVGQSAWEEVNYLSRNAARGANFGWPAFEGNEPFDSNRPGPDAPTFPVLAYPNSDETGNCAITGGYVVRGGGPGPLVGRYLYADFCVGELRSFAVSGGGDDRSLGLSVSNPTSFGEGRRGRIYVASLNGPVYEIVAG